MELKIQHDEQGDYIQIPQETLDTLGWNEFTLLSFEFKHREIILTQKTEWSLEEIQKDENLENIMDDIVHNGTLHYIIDNGKKYILAPYTEELSDILDK